MDALLTLLGLVFPEPTLPEVALLVVLVLTALVIDENRNR